MTEINIIQGKFNLSEDYRSNWMLWQIYNRQLQGWHWDLALFWYYLENLSEYVVTCLWICLKAFNAALYQLPGPNPINRFRQYLADKGNTGKNFTKICLSAAPCILTMLISKENGKEMHLTGKLWLCKIEKLIFIFSAKM